MDLELIGRYFGKEKLLDELERQIPNIRDAFESAEKYDEWTKSDPEKEQMERYIEIARYTFNSINDELPRLIGILIADLIEAKGVKYKSREAVENFNLALENVIPLDSQDLLSTFLADVSNIKV